MLGGMDDLEADSTLDASFLAMAAGLQIQSSSASVDLDSIIQ